jgi:MOSC domain-containing protein YiiM
MHEPFMVIVSVNVGRPRDVPWHDRMVRTAIFKEPVAGRVAVRRHNLEGDGQADLTVHGGEHKAVYAYPASHYAFWRRELPDAALRWGNFGENLTIDDFDERTIRVGDIFIAGTAKLIATQPRLPCFKLGIRFGRDDMVDRFLASGRTGVYFAVSEEGALAAGDAVIRAHTDPNAITVADAARLYTGRTDDPDLLRKAVNSPALPEGWRQRFLRRLATPA